MNKNIKKYHKTRIIFRISQTMNKEHKETTRAANNYEKYFK